MNRYSLRSESRTWWIPSTAAGTLGLAAVTALFALPVGGAQALPVGTTRSEQLVAPTQVGTAIERPCFLRQAHWNRALDNDQPTCPLPGAAPSGTPPARHVVLRPWLDYGS
jgi:hypothetical protein